MSKKQVAGYILDKRIGKGSYATVWKGRVEGSCPEEAVAVKVISRQTVTETSQLRQEVDVLRRIAHTNIVRFRDLKKSAAHFYLVLEFCAGGDLSQFLKGKGKAAEEVARRFLTQIASGLCVLHGENVLHRDLKPQNILLSDTSDDPVLKIADFGFARALQPQDMAATVCGSPLYMAPEILRHEPYDAKADLWSVGAILFELLTGRPPFSGENPMQLLANIERSSERLSFKGVQVSDECQDFLRSLLQRNPEFRLTSSEFAKHAYVRLPERQGAQGPEGSTLLVPSGWCMPASEMRERGAGSPSSGVPSPVLSHTASPVTCRSPEGGSPRDASFELACEGLPPSPQASAGGPSRDLRAGLAAGAAAPAGQGAERDQAPGQASRPAGAGTEEEYVVVTAQALISAWARGRGPTPQAAANDFCGNLSRIANALGQLAARLQEQSPVEALALLLRALGLLEKAMNVSLAEEETSGPLREAFLRVLERAEEAARQVNAARQLPSGVESLHPPACPNAVVFDYAVQQARDAAVACSKGWETGGWEVPCHEKLTLALLLLDLLGSEADGEDLAAISSYTAPIARLVGEIEQRLGRPARGDLATEARCEEKAPSSAPRSPATRAMAPPSPLLQSAGR